MTDKLMKKPHPILRLADEEAKRNMAAYALGRSWCSKGWPVQTNPFAAMSYPIEHDAFNRAWRHWKKFYDAAGVEFRTKKELLPYERALVLRQIVRYALRHPSTTVKRGPGRPPARTLPPEAHAAARRARENESK